MELKKQLNLVAMCSTLLFSATSAEAFGSYLTDVNNAYQSSYTNCLICHGTAGGGGDKGVTAYANQYRATHSAANIKANDADGDGFTNGQEGLLTADLNSKAVNPFTIKLAAVAATDTALTDVVVLGDNAAVQAAFVVADGGITLATGASVTGGIKVTLNNANATLMFKAGGLDSTAKVYAVNTAAKTNIVLTATTDWAANPDGSVIIKALPAGSTFPVDIVVERAVSTATAPTVAGGASVTGCISAGLTTPIMMFIAFLSLGFFVRRKQG